MRTALSEAIEQLGGVIKELVKNSGDAPAIHCHCKRKLESNLELLDDALKMFVYKLYNNWEIKII